MPEAIGSHPRFSFEMTLLDVAMLVHGHDDYTNRARGRPPEFIEVFKRAGVILTVTAWETYVEDALKLKFEERLRHAKSVSDMKSTFNAVSQAWLESTPNLRPKPTDLARWTGSGWKHILRDKFEKDIADLNTPNSSNIRKLFKRYLDVDVTRHWRWQGVSSTRACGMLDSLIQFRGGLVHRGKTLKGGGVKRSALVGAMHLVANLAWTTEKALGIALPQRTDVDDLLKDSS